MKSEVPIEVVCGIIFNNGQVLIARKAPNKSMAGKWEFPGGKIKEGENPEQALKRELREELGMEVSVNHFIADNHHFYEDFAIRLHAFKCEFISASFELTDHDRVEWIHPLQLSLYDLAEADKSFISMIIESPTSY